MSRRYRPVTALVLKWRKRNVTVHPDLLKGFEDALDVYELKHGFAGSLRSDKPEYSTKAETAGLFEWLRKRQPIARAAQERRRRLETARWKADVAKRQAAEARAQTRLVAKYPLPEHVSAADLRSPSDKDRYGYGEVDLGGVGHGSDFEIWYTERFGWVAPTLAIRGAGRSGLYKPRSYGVALKDGQTVRVGQGPHVLASLRVYVKRSNVKRLKPVLDRLRQGAVDANDTRDRISTRMARRRGGW